MAKRLMVLLGMLALALTTALPAFAQETPQYGGEEIAATGVLREGLPQDVGASELTRSPMTQRANSTRSGARERILPPSKASR